MSVLISIIGRPNVGKSTLFNRIVGEQRALVHDIPGVTRDRLYSSVQWRTEENIVDFTLVDTGGLEPEKKETLRSYVSRQAEVAIEESDLVIAVVDGRAGLLPDDAALVRKIRRSGKKMVLCVNKIDSNVTEGMMLPFYELGIEPIFPVSAQHNRGVEEMVNSCLKALGPFRTAQAQSSDKLIRLAIIGRPNVGKSRLLNYLCGEERSIVSAEPGTTRDPIDTLVTHGKQKYLLVDTAGIRRQAKVSATLEYLTVLRSLRAVGRCDIAVLVIDVNEGVTHQDLRLASQVLLRGKGLVCFYNKCDLLQGKAPKKFPHFEFVRACSGAAKFSQGMEPLLKIVKQVMRSYRRRFATPNLNRTLKEIAAGTATPRPNGKPLKLRYITQVSNCPPSFHIFVNHLDRLTDNYKKYVENSLYKKLRLASVPIKLHFKQ